MGVFVNKTRIKKTKIAHTSYSTPSSHPTHHFSQPHNNSPNVVLNVEKS